MSKLLLDNRDNIEILVSQFYIRVKKDELLGPIFNNAENFSWDTRRKTHNAPNAFAT